MCAGTRSDSTRQTAAQTTAAQSSRASCTSSKSASRARVSVFGARVASNKLWTLRDSTGGLELRAASPPAVPRTEEKRT